MITASAPGKVILCGEHAVVYGRPAIAVPVAYVQARVALEENPAGLLIRAVDLNQSDRYTDLDPAHPLAAIIRLTLLTLGGAAVPNATLTITSTIPAASGLGSGAAVSTAIVRALAQYYGHDLSTQTISDLVYQVEKIHHGTPSGIDNTVIAYAQPVYFKRPSPNLENPLPTPPQSAAVRVTEPAPLCFGDYPDPQPATIQPFPVPTPFTLLIADTGIASPTRIVVGDVRQAWESDRARYESLFDQCGQIAEAAYHLIRNGRPLELGPLLTQNQAVLRDMGVSSPDLDALVQAALASGALGAKLSGGGRGGNMIALVTDETAARVEAALLKTRAKRVITTVVGESEN
ncbi:MAG TPA: mevalonate kinase [Anaerolineales bacterium]|nr:mevalonate kinase [Anaerolineales bacterium]